MSSRNGDRKKNSHMVALFEGDPQDSGLRLLARTRNPRLVRQVRQWFASDQGDGLSCDAPSTDNPTLVAKGEPEKLDGTPASQEGTE